MSPKPDDCVLIPVHPPKLAFLVSLLASLYGGEAHGSEPPSKAVLLVSNDQDSSFFAAALARYHFFTNVVLFDVEKYLQTEFNSGSLVSRLQNNVDGCVVNLKKMAGLHYISASRRGHAICLDCDAISLMAANNVLKKTRDSHQHAMYCGGHIAGPASIVYAGVMSETLSLFGASEQDRVRRSTRDLSVYTWFSDIPSYDGLITAELFDYFCHIYGSMETFLSQLRWGTFDHLVYTYFRVARFGAVVYDYTAELGIVAQPEFLDRDHIELIREKSGYGINWMPYANLRQAISPGHMPELAMLMHVDR